MMRSPLIWPLVIVASALVIGLLVFGNVVSPVRPVISLWFLLFCPGMAFVQLLHIKDPIGELALAVALSLAIASILATAMVYARLWSPRWGLGILIGISVFGAVLQVIDAYLPARREDRQHR
jgi:uncharacterized membrane protein